MSDSEEEDIISKQDPFKTAQHYFDKFQSVLESEALRLRQEREAFDVVAKKLKHVQFSSTVKLNVGGQVFTTSLQTLNKDAGSMLHAMFSGRFDTKPLEDGSYFIDRDGTCFRYILNYLRTGKLLLPDDELIRKEVLEEAMFYQIQGIVEKLRPKPYSQSVILSPDHRTWLVEAVGKTYDSVKLLYRASRDGWMSANFHNCCDRKGPTLVVIKSGNYIFGGYTEQAWESLGGTWKTDDKAFMFSLVNYVGIEPTKMKIKPAGMNNAICCNSNLGPVFGRGNDLLIANNPNSYNCSVILGSTYDCPPGQTGTTFLTGNQNFLVSEMEVFEHVMDSD